MILISYLLLTCLVTAFDLSLKVREDIYQVINNGQLQSNFNESIYNSGLNCQNGYLELIQFQSNETSQLTFLYSNYEKGQSIRQQDIKISVQPNQSPYPIAFIISKGINGMIGINRKCSPQGSITSNNYFNKIKMQLDSYQWSFLINCDKGQRHKKFQYGYLFLMVLNAIITVSVAKHSKIWSIRYKKNPISIWLSWKRFMAIFFILIGASVGFLYFAGNNLELANSIVKYLGLIASIFFVFICMSQIFFLFRPLKKQIYKFVRICDIVSTILTFLVLLLGLLIDFWMINDVLAVCICVGTIKLFNFKTMKESVISMSIEVVIITCISIVLHFKLEKSYNDYASQLSSPLFFVMPDLISSLYKKCSWLCVFDITIPGVLMAYLRQYDQNYSTRYIYTIMANIIFILSTILWILIELWYPFSVPFCLVTYPCLMTVITLIAIKRNQFKTLWQGTFNREGSKIYVSDEEKSFSDIMTQQFLDEQKIRQSQNSDESVQDIAKGQQNYINVK